MPDNEIVVHSLDELYSEDFYEGIDFEGDYEIAEYEGGANYE